MQVTTMPIGNIKPYENNPRLNKNAIGKVADSLKEFGWRQPIVVDENNVIIVGHTRYEAAKRLKMDEVPVHVMTGLSDAQVKAYRLADNRTGEDAAWDNDLLIGELKSLDELGVDLSITGFASLEIDEMFSKQPRRQTDKNHVPPLQPTPLTQPGEIWQLGDHYLICGDATLPATYEALLGDERLDMVWTDPPYNIAYESADGKTIENDDMDSEAFAAMLDAAMANSYHHTKKGGAIYVAHSESEGVAFRQAMTNAGWLHKQTLIWVKDHFTLGRQDYQWQHEPILYGWKPGAGHRWHGTAAHSTVLDGMKGKLEQMDREELLEALQVIYREQSTIIRVDKPKRSAEHPTMKPVQLVEKMIRNSSRRKNLVLDPFGVSGSTLMACETTGRKARLIELDPKYCDVIVRRWQEYTGEYAILKGTGEPFQKREQNQA